MTEQERIQSIKNNGGRHLQNFKRENITYDMCVVAVSMNGTAMEFVPKEFLTLEIYEISCRNYGPNLRLVPSDYITSEMCFDAVRSASESLDFVPEKYRSPALFKEAALSHPEALKRIPPEIVTPEFCAEVINKNGAVLEENEVPVIDYLPKPQKNTSFYLQLVALRPEVLWNIPKKHRTQAVCQQALDSGWHGSLLEAVKERPEFLGLVPPNMYDHQSCLVFVKSTYFHDSITSVIGPQYNNGNLVLAWHGHYEYNMSKLLQWHDVALIVVKYHFGFLHYVPSKTITEELCWEAVKANAASFSSVPSKFCTKELCVYAFERYKYALGNIPEEYITSEMCDEAVAYSGSIFRDVPEKYKTRELCKKALTDHTFLHLSDIPDRLMDKEIALLCIRSHIASLSQIPDHIRDVEVCLAAVTNNRQDLQYVPEVLLSNNLVKAAVERFGWVPGIPERFITEELMLFDIKQNPWDYTNLPKEHLTKQVCLEALKYPSSRNRGLCLKDIPTRFVDAEFCAEFIQAKPDCIHEIPEQYRTKELLLFSAKLYPYIVESSIPEILRQDNEFMEAFEELKAQA